MSCENWAQYSTVGVVAFSEEAANPNFYRKCPGFAGDGFGKVVRKDNHNKVTSEYSLEESENVNHKITGFQEKGKEALSLAVGADLRVSK